MMLLHVFCMCAQLRRQPSNIIRTPQKQQMCRSYGRPCKKSALLSDKRKEHERMRYARIANT